MMKGFMQIALCGVLALSLSSQAWARIKLVTLPDRMATVVQLENDSDTLLSEERELNLQAGITQVDFAWQSVHIVPNSIRLQVLMQQQAVTILNVSYPPNSQALVWEISSPIAQTVRVRISYLLRGLDRLVTYRGQVNKAETTLQLTGFMVLRNFSGEDLAAAAFQPGQGIPFKGSVQNRETKRIQFFNTETLAIQKRFVFDARQLPWEPELAEHNVGIPVFYEFTNSAANGLGQHPLWAGKARLYGADSQGDVIFLGEDNAAFTPVGEKLMLNIGESRDVVVTQRKIAEQRLNERRNQKNHLVLYDTEETMQVTLENFREQPALVTLKEGMPLEWEMKNASHAFTREDNQLIHFELTIPARDKITVNYTFYQRNVRP